MSAHVPRLRMALLGLIFAAMFTGLGMRLYGLQVVDTTEYEVQAEANRVRTVQLPAPRGRILDRHGEVIVDNRVASVVAIDRAHYDELSDDERNELLLRLIGELNADGQEITADQIESRLNDARFSPYAPVPIARDISEELRIYLAERSADFPAVIAERTTIREYPHGALASNLLGYVGSITEGELEDLEESETAGDKPYDLNDTIGKAGLELAQEEHLRGTPGSQKIEVDAEGRPVRTIEEVAPRPGSDIYLTIDLNLQAVTQDQLELRLEEARQRPPRAGRPQNQGTRGAVVVEDPNNGDVLAMASYPTYDPRDFVDGISQARWEELNDPANHYPLNNWAIQGQWAPGSTYKLFTAYAGLSSGVIGPDTVYNDGGGYTIPGCTQEPCTVSNSGGANGSLTIREALQVSSNAYFANIGGMMWLQQDQLGGEEAMQGYMETLGLGQASGIPLSYEAEGRVPSSVWTQEYCDAIEPEYCDRNWTAGHNAHMAIGQGSVLVTPLQLANGYSTVANGGTLYQPQIVDRIEPPDGDAVTVEPEVTDEVPMPPEVRDPIQDGLMNVTRAGTASSAFGGFPLDTWPVAGKTGTGEFEEKAHTATFVSYGPVNAPQYAISVVMEESDFGGVSAAPIARSLYDILANNPPVAEAPLGADYELPGPEEDEEAGAAEGPVVD